MAWSLGWALDGEKGRWHILRPEYLPAKSQYGGWNPKHKRWQPPAGFEAKYGPKWRLHEVKVWPAAGAWRQARRIPTTAPGRGEDSPADQGAVGRRGKSSPDAHFFLDFAGGGGGELGG